MQRFDTEITTKLVAHVVSHYCAPSETFTADTVEEMDDLGWRAHVLTWSTGNRETFPFPAAERVHCPPARSRPRRLWHKARRLRDDEWFATALYPGIAPLRAALVHAHFGWAATHATGIADRLGAPLVVTFHASDLTAFPHAPRWPPVLKRPCDPYGRVFERIDRAIVVSRYMERELRGLGFSGPIDTIPAGVRLAKFAFRGTAPAGADTRLLFVGRLVHRKGLHVLLSAMPRVLAADPSVRLDVVGDGPDRLRAEGLARTLGVRDRIFFHGTQPPTRVARLLRDAHVSVVPSLTLASGETEGSPVVTKEALAVGVPVVATLNGGLPETIPPPYRNELVPEGDATALGDRIIAALCRRDEWPRRVLEGRRWVEREFDSLKLARRTSDTYAEALRTHPRLG